MSSHVTRDTTITVMDAYIAMFKYLEHLQRLTHSDDLAGLLGGMSLLGDTEVTADAAAWGDWIRIVSDVRQSPPDITLHLNKIR
jgi:hypothetical protein